MVYFRIHMVGAAREDDAAPPVFFHIAQDLLTPAGNFHAHDGQLFPSLGHGVADSGFRYAEFRRAKQLYQLGGERIFCGERHKRIIKTYFAGDDFLHVIFDIFCVGGHNGAVVVVI